MEDILVLLGFFALVAYISKLISDTRIRRKALESSLPEDKVEQLLSRGGRKPSTRSALKWGLVVIALGIGLLVVDLFAISFESPFAYAVLLLATGNALLGYYLIERENEETDEGPFSPSDAPAPESVGEAEL